MGQQKCWQPNLCTAFGCYYADKGDRCSDAPDPKGELLPPVKLVLLSDLGVQSPGEAEKFAELIKDADVTIIPMGDFVDGPACENSDERCWGDVTQGSFWGPDLWFCEGCRKC